MDGLLYTTHGRIAHTFMDLPIKGHVFGTYTTDDFGNSVLVESRLVTAHCRQQCEDWFSIMEAS